ncbi:MULTISPECIES: YgaP family membrane protein [Haloarcula]|uniref:YgaP family membrane protein n=1 Tax=Haloarcula TaxID=2237 RepID=UPI0023EC5FF5|nr:DUF2892 domain-containing protein [Halomicroarcula sp. XH51]
MQKNVGGIDRIARLVLGPVLLIVGVAAISGILTITAGTTGLVVAALLLVVGAVFTVTGLTQTCPLHSILGFNTFRSDGSSSTTDDVGPESKSD